jgi:hypothetical protein
MVAEEATVTKSSALLFSSSDSFAAFSRVNLNENNINRGASIVFSTLTTAIDEIMRWVIVNEHTVSNASALACSSRDNIFQFSPVVWPLTSSSTLFQVRS